MKTFKELVLEIEENNEKFLNATKAEKRVIIAEDCLIRIESKYFKPEDSVVIDSLDYGISNHNKSLQTLINAEDPIICSGCAKGGLFLSYVGRVNKVKLNDEGELFISSDFSDNTKLENLLEIFSREQLDLIEVAFEGLKFPWTKVEDKDSVNKALEFFNDISEDHMCRGDVTNNDEILKAICENIIENKGTFKP